MFAGLNFFTNANAVVRAPESGKSACPPKQQRLRQHIRKFYLVDIRGLFGGLCFFNEANYNYLIFPLLSIFEPLISNYDTAYFFGCLGTNEIIIILVIVLLMFGGKKIPELMRGLGKGVREFNDAKTNVKREIEESTNVPASTSTSSDKPAQP